MASRGGTTNNNNNNVGGEGEVDEQQEDNEIRGITDPRDSDVLCGRGGAALRHPGNQTYRRLVNLNKGLYITCLKTEKLKISRSIVAAIREQKGRFLEKEGKDAATWFDIGDKKAIEKTSQALREGQPKLRQKIVEMGGAAAIEAQYSQAGLYPTQIALSGSTSGTVINPTMLASTSSAPVSRSHQLMEQHHAAALGAAQVASLHEQLHEQDMVKQDLHAEMFQRLSSRNLNADPEEQLRLQQQAARLRPSMTQRSNIDLGIGQSQLSLMSDFSGIGSGDGQSPSMLTMDVNNSFRRPYGANSQQFSHQQHQQPSEQMSMGGTRDPYGSQNSNSMQPGYHYQQQQQQQSSSGRDRLANVDRRRVFAKMKYGVSPSSSNMPPPHSSIRGGLSATQHSYGDGMPDIHMVESTMSLLSNMSIMTTENTSVANAGKAAAEERGRDNNNNNNREPFRPPYAPPQTESAKLNDHSRDIHWGGLGAGSRHSVMSGLSRIDDQSSIGGGSVFSDADAAKKVNISARSIAMSEISGFDVQEGNHEDEGGSPDYDRPRKNRPSATQEYKL